MGKVITDRTNLKEDKLYKLSNAGLEEFATIYTESSVEDRKPLTNIIVRELSKIKTTFT